MLELEGELPEVYLQPGELYLARKPAIIRTLLGSCVGITFWSPRLRIGALCHSLLPWCPSSLSDTVNSMQGRRYVDYCVRDLARQFDELSTFRAEIQVKLFGGADVLLVHHPSVSKPTVGKQNSEAAIEVLKVEGYEVMASSLGGKFGRTLKFNTGTGEVLLRWLAKVAHEEILVE